jgi:RecB family exonuclease
VANDTFLYEVARDLYEKSGADGDLSQTTVVTPSRRTKLFMNKYFSDLSGGRPLWAPQYANIVQLCELASPLRIYDGEVQRIGMVWGLYDAYRSVRDSRGMATAEAFDEFYYFGEVLLHDFDDIDKDLVAAEKLYAGVADLKRLEDWSFLDEGQKAVVRRFLNFDIEEKSRLQSAFFDIWNVLAEVYARFKENLRRGGVAYEGMLLRDVVERMPAPRPRPEASEVAGGADAAQADGLFPARRYAFVGFNHLSRAEARLFSHLKDRALFYWDYDKRYLEAEAGKYLRRHLQEFPDALPDGDRDHFARAKEIVFLEAANPVSQTGYVARWVEDVVRRGGGAPASGVSRASDAAFEDAASAIVLCDVKLLPPVLSQLPEGVKPNIAILYTLMQAPIAGYLTQLAELQVKGVRDGAFGLDYLLPVLKNRFTRCVYAGASRDIALIQKTKRLFVDPGAVLPIVDGGADAVATAVLTDATLFRVAGTPPELVRYLREVVEKIAEGRQVEGHLEIAALSEAYKMLNGLEVIAQSVLKNESALKLLKRLLLSVKISYAGEPAKGLQVMAMSDTRNMDFKNLLVLSANEGVLPAVEPEASFIPPLLRKAFGMPSIDDQDAQNAYNFHRLLQRAENVALAYSAGRSGMGKGEKSRYLMQLQWEGAPSRRGGSQTFTLKGAPPLAPGRRALSVAKTAAMLDALRGMYDGKPGGHGKPHALSPSAFNDFIECPLRFYFKYVAGLRVPEGLDSSLNGAYLGNIFHKAMEKVYGKPHGEGGTRKDAPLAVTPDFFAGHLVPGASGEVDAIAPATKRLIEDAFVEEYFKTPTARGEYDGEQNIYFQVVERMVRNALTYDRRRAPFDILGLEEEHYFDVELGDGTRVRVGGIIDRIDRKDGLVRVVDYKTGKVPREGDYGKTIEDVFQEDRKKKAGYQFQTFLYSLILGRETHAPVAPALLFALAADDDGYSPALKLGGEEIKDFRDYEEPFAEQFRSKLGDLFNEAVPFRQCEKDDNCRYCDYAGVCDRSPED